MLTSKEIDSLLSSAETMMLAEYRQATTPAQVYLSSEMAAALGMPSRRLVPFLATVVDVISNKLELDDRALRANKVKVSKELQKWLGDGGFGEIERDLYAAVVRDGEAYVLTTWDTNGPKFTVRESYNGMCGAGIVEEDDVPRYAFNAWQCDGNSYIDLYYPHEIQKYIKAKDSKEWQPRTDAPDELWPVPWIDAEGNPLGIAITEFEIDGSDIEDAIQLGRDMNETLLDLLATSRTQGWPQRYLKGQKNPGTLLNEHGQMITGPTGRPIRHTVHATPGSIMQLSEGAEMGQLDAVKPDTAVLDKLMEMLSFVTCVPSHYFSGQWPSGVALIQAESRLNHKVEDHQGRLTPAIVAVIRLAMRLSNFFAGTSFDTEQDIVVPWHSPEIETEDLKQSRKTATEDSLTKLVSSGLMSKETAVRELHQGWDETEIQAELIKLGIVQDPEMSTMPNMLPVMQ